MLRRGGDVEILLRRRAGITPVAEALFQERHHLGERGIADDEDRRVRRAQPIVVEFGELRRRQPGDDRGIAAAAERHAIGVILAIEQRRQGAQRQPDGLFGFRCDRRQLLPAHAIHLGGRERRMPHDIRHQIERRREIGGQRGQIDARSIHARRGGNIRAQIFLGLGDLHRSIFVSAFIEHAEHERLGAERILRVRCVAGVEIDRHAHHRHAGSLREQHRNAVGKLGMLDGREDEIGDPADRRQLRPIDPAAGCRRGLRACRQRHRGRCASTAGAIAVDRRFLIGAARAGGEREGEHGSRQPFLRRGAHLGRGQRRLGGELLLVEARIVRIDRARRERHRLAAESADRFQALDGGRDAIRLGAAQFGFGRAVLDEIGDHLIELLADQGGIDAGLHHRLDGEFPHALIRLVVGGNADGGLLVADQLVIEPRARQAAEHAGDHFQRRRILVGQPRHRPHPGDGGIRDLVMEGHRHRLGQRRHLGRRRDRLRSARDIAEIFLDQRLGLGRRNVAGEHQHRVVRAVMRSEPVLHDVETGLVEIGHRSDHRVVIRIARGKQRLLDRILQQPAGLIVVTALFVLDHAALDIELLLRDRGQQMPHAIAFKEQRAVERRAGHRLEIIGAIVIGRSVHVGRAHRLHRLEPADVAMLRTAEHQMLEQMREAGAPGGLVLRSDMIPDGHRDDRRLVIGVDDHL